MREGSEEEKGRGRGEGKGGVLNGSHTNPAHLYANQFTSK